MTEGSIQGEHITVTYAPNIAFDLYTEMLWTAMVLEKGMATHSSILTWRIPWTERTVHGVTKSQTWLSDYTCTLAAMKGDTDSTTIVVGNFNTPFTQQTDHSDRK